LTGAIRVDNLTPIGRGINRPEQVLVTADGRVLASDKDSAVAEVTGDNVRGIGDAGGEPNGISMSQDGRVLIANWGLGCIQEVDPETEAVRPIVTSETLGRSMKWANFVLVDRRGDLWASCSTASGDFGDVMAFAKPDGFLIRAESNGANPVVVAEGVVFPNCMALDQDEAFLYVVRTTPAAVMRFPIRADRTLGDGEQFGPDLGARRPDEVGEQVVATALDPATQKRWGMADGCAFDAAGNLWVTVVGPEQIVAITPEGEAFTIVEGGLIQAPTSIAFGGADMRDVYIGSNTAPYVLQGRSTVSGLQLVHQRHI
jgi:sugar lactone lactonase YvrE